MEKNRTSSSLTAYAGLKSIEVFKTNVSEEKEADQLTSLLSLLYPRYDVHFDLEDCDNIMRIEGYAVSNDQIVTLLSSYGFQCTVLV